VGDLANQLGVISLHVSLDYGGRVLGRLTVADEAALTPDDLRHELSFVPSEARPARLQDSAILLATTVANKDPTRIQLCGRLAVELAGRDLTARIPGGQARVLFTYLTVNRTLDLHRDELVDALWPWRAPQGAQASLSALLSRLRSVVGSEVLAARGEIRVCLPAGAWIDLEAAEEAIHRAESAVARSDWARGWGPSLIALFTARRGFLAGEDLPWATEHRRRLDEIRCSALECYAAVALGVGGTELASGEKCARELVATAPFRERGHGLLMELLAARGNVAEALRVYETLRVRLREELGATPAAELRDLQAQLLHR
jgi:DNA-binding SARP family transcriptional activator